MSVKYVYFVSFSLFICRTYYIFFNRSAHFTFLYSVLFLIRGYIFVQLATAKAFHVNESGMIFEHLQESFSVSIKILYHFFICVYYL
jgi:hypothetical protein